MGKINFTGNNRVGALDEKLSQELSGASFKLVRVTRRCQLDEHGEVGHSGRREQSVVPAPPFPPPPAPQAHWRSNSQVPWVLWKIRCVLAGSRPCKAMCGRKWHLNLTPECWVQQELFGNSWQVILSNVNFSVVQVARNWSSLTRLQMLSPY